VFAVPNKAGECALLDVLAYDGSDAADVLQAAKDLIRGGTLQGWFAMNKHRDMPHVVTSFKLRKPGGGYERAIVMPPEAMVNDAPTVQSSDKAIVIDDDDDDDALEAEIQALKSADTINERVAAAVAAEKARLEEETRKLSDAKAAQAKAEEDEKRARDRAAKRAELLALQAILNSTIQEQLKKTVTAGVTTAAMVDTSVPINAVKPLVTPATTNTGMAPSLPAKQVLVTAQGQVSNQTPAKQVVATAKGQTSAATVPSAAKSTGASVPVVLTPSPAPDRRTARTANEEPAKRQQLFP